MNSKSDSGFSRALPLPAPQDHAENTQQPLCGKTVKRVTGPIDGSSRQARGVKFEVLRVGGSRPLGSCISLTNVERDIRDYKADDGLDLVQRALEDIGKLKGQAKNQSLSLKIEAIEEEFMKLKQSGMHRGDVYNFATDVRNWLEKELKSSD
ncbi:hypothetical protein [Labrenzia sp. THAF82]|uniref:hypothetical protein n=1 Tax=Labrenzia sp. THAF82 TaxID=2587861 RepID=UPI00126954B7|nr:hypothetical protein [Labrenzia sp. THAF82]